MSQEGRGCLVADQGGSDKVALFKIEGRGSGPAVPPLDPRMLLFIEGSFTKRNSNVFFFFCSTATVWDLYGGIFQTNLWSRLNIQITYYYAACDLNVGSCR